MVELLTALQTTFNASSDLTTRFPNGLEVSRGAAARSTPFCVVDIVSAVPGEFETGSRCLTKFHLQFNVFASDDTTAGAGEFVANAIDSIKQTFDFIKLPLATQQSVQTRRLNERLYAEDEKVWHGIVEYEAWIGETLPR